MVHRGQIRQVLCSHNVQPEVYIRVLQRCDYLTGRISLNPDRRWQVMGGVKNSFPPSLDVSSIQIHPLICFYRYIDRWLKWPTTHHMAKLPWVKSFVHLTAVALTYGVSSYRINQVVNTILYL